MKFLPNERVLPEHMAMGVDFTRDNKKEWRNSPLAKLMMEIDGVERCFIGDFFITITKDPDYEWYEIKPVDSHPSTQTLSTNLLLSSSPHACIMNRN